MNPMSKFYVPAPQDDRWNTQHPKTVIEALESDTISRVKVIAPAFFARDYPIIPSGPLLECSGPARSLTRDEYIELVHSLIPDHPLPKGYKPKTTEVFQQTIATKPQGDAQSPN